MLGGPNRGGEWTAIGWGERVLGRGWLSLIHILVLWLGMKTIGDHCPKATVPKFMWQRHPYFAVASSSRVSRLLPPWKGRNPRWRTQGSWEKAATRDTP